MTALTSPRPRRPVWRRASVRYILLTAFALPWVILPLWMLVVNSFKTKGEASIPSLSLPSHWHIGPNYSTVVHQGSYFSGLANSTVVAIPTILTVLLFGSMAAWSYARSEARSLRFAYYASSLTMVLPPAIIPTVYVLIHLGINGTRFGYFMTLVGTRIGMVVFLTTGFVRTLPISLEEAAQIDGASRWRTYWSIVLPLLRPVLFSAAIILAISVWNDFFYALFLLRDQGEATLPLRLYQFAANSTGVIAWNLVFADVVLTGLPMFLLYMVLQRRVLSGLAEGGVTG